MSSDIFDVHDFVVRESLKDIFGEIKDLSTAVSELQNDTSAIVKVLEDIKTLLEGFSEEKYD